jgi:hypothetical protein
MWVACAISNLTRSPSSNATFPALPVAATRASGSRAAIADAV